MARRTGLRRYEGRLVPISFEIDREKRLVSARATGVLTHDDLIGYQDDAWSSDEVMGFDEIVDMSSVEQIAFESSRRVSELASLAAQKDLKGDPSRLAIVAPSLEAYGLARMYQTYRETAPRSTRTVRVFRSLTEAQEWLRK